MSDNCSADLAVRWHRQWMAA